MLPFSQIFKLREYILEKLRRVMIEAEIHVNGYYSVNLICHPIAFVFSPGPLWRVSWLQKYII